MNPKELRNKIAELLGIKLTAKDAEDLSVFTPEQLTEAETKAREAFNTAADDKNLTVVREMKEAILAVKGEVASRAEVEASTEAELAALRAEIDATDETPPADEPPADEPPVETPPADEPPVEVTPPVETPPADAPVEAPVAVDIESIAASVAAKLGLKTGTIVIPVPDPSPVPAATTNPVTITAAGDVKGHSAGMEMKPTALADAFLNKSEAILRAEDGSRHEIARVQWEYPTERTLNSLDHPDTNSLKINPVVRAAQERTREILSEIRSARGDLDKLVPLTAAGGLCAPVNVRYDIFTVGSTTRPLRDGLNRFGADRGGIRFNKPPVLTDVNGSVAIYEEADDKTGARYPKDCLAVGCGPIEEVKVGAVELCMKVGNFQRLSFPENFQAWWQLGRVWHARQAEARLWGRIVTEAMDLTATRGIGASRSILAILAMACAQYRDRHRIDEETPLRVFMPSWIPDMMQIDLLSQAPGDNAMDVTDAQIASYFANFNIAVTYVMDGQPASAGATYVQAASGALNHFPTHADFVVAIDGTLLFLDMGVLDFGTEIRDFTLIRTNDTGAFMETFENFANVGPDFERITISGLCADGTTAGPDATITCAS